MGESWIQAKVLWKWPLSFESCKMGSGLLLKALRNYFNLYDNKFRPVTIKCIGTPYKKRAHGIELAIQYDAGTIMLSVSSLEF